MNENSILGTDIWKYNKAVKDKSVGQEAIESVLRQIIQVKVIGKEAAIEKVQLATDDVCRDRKTLYHYGRKRSVRQSKALSRAVARLFRCQDVYKRQN